jgi:organic radical activating enzyme
VFEKLGVDRSDNTEIFKRAGGFKPKQTTEDKLHSLLKEVLQDGRKIDEIMALVRVDRETTIQEVIKIRESLPAVVSPPSESAPPSARPAKRSDREQQKRSKIQLCSLKTCEARWRQSVGKSNKKTTAI